MFGSRFYFISRCQIGLERICSIILPFDIVNRINYYHQSQMLKYIPLFHRDSSNTRVWLVPQLTLEILWTGSCSTGLTCRLQPELPSSFCSRPSWPSLPLPIMKSLPYLVRRAVWAPPQLMLLILWFNWIFLGKNWSLLSPCPNCP